MGEIAEMMLDGSLRQECSCGNEPKILNVINSVLGLVVAGCSKCKTSGPARMTAIQAIAEWNKGRRVLVNCEQALNLTDNKI